MTSNIEKLRNMDWITKEDLQVEKEYDNTSMKIIDAWVDEKGIRVKLKVWNGRNEVVKIIRYYLFHGSEKLVEIPGEMVVSGKAVYDLAEKIKGLEIWGFVSKRGSTLSIYLIKNAFISSKGIEVTTDSGDFVLIPCIEGRLIIPFSNTIITKEEGKRLCEYMKGKEIKVNDYYDSTEQIKRLFDKMKDDEKEELIDER